MIKNLHLLDLNEAERIAVICAANLHKQMSNIQFEIREANKDVIDVLTIQGYHASNNYADRDTLFNRTIELIQPFTKDKIITCKVTCYEDMVTQN